MPIYDLDTWNILVRRANEALDKFYRKVYTSDPKDYLLFDGLTASMFYSDLAKALEQLKMKHRSSHKTRHTYLAWFYDKINEDSFLAEKIAGHRDKRDIERRNPFNRKILGGELSGIGSNCQLSLSSFSRSQNGNEKWQHSYSSNGFF
jgi:integrase